MEEIRRSSREQTFQQSKCQPGAQEEHSEFPNRRRLNDIPDDLSDRVIHGELFGDLDDHTLTRQCRIPLSLTWHTYGAKPCKII